MPVDTQVPIRKIQNLPPEKAAEAHAQDRALTRMATQASESSFASVWDNAENEAYDAL